MKTEYWVLLGVAGYFLYTRNPLASGGVSTIAPNNPSRSTGSGGTTASGVSGGSTSNPPIGGIPGGSVWNNPSGFYTCMDGTEVNDPSLCPVDTSGYITCADGSLVNDASLCPENTGYVDSGDPCDPNSWAYDAATCSGIPDQTVPVDYWGGTPYDAGTDYTAGYL
jgi:hypothetical protein